ncbi:hypothetical protein B0H34DRAFT_842867 [Crassisporium funariophilum]|nr:hypothetical protein B0H34DRAFT_842867 [Crassisporium funariophilum]
MNVWTEHRNPEGRTYWFNTGTKQSVWEKPDDLKTPFERALNQTKWKEYFSGGRKYYYNTETKESKWDMPDELLLVLEKVEKEPQAPENPPQRAAPAPGFTPVGVPIQGGLVPIGGADPSSSSSASQPSQQNGNSLAVGAHTGPLPLAASSVLPPRPNLPDDPVIPHNGFVTVEEGEKAFMHLLRKAGVDANWTWDQTMRAIITDPLYKALNTLAEKKASWEKYTNALKVKEQEERDARLSKYRPAIRNMLKGNPNVFHYTTFQTADKLFSQHPIWQQARFEAERKFIFEEYISELVDREVNETRAARARSVSKVVALFKQLDVNVVTRWRHAHELLTQSEEWHADPELRKLPTLDILLAFEDYSRVREREYEEQMRRAQVEKTRKERKAREAFKTLLREFVQSGVIKERTKWKEIYPRLRDDDRYHNMLGNPGSNPLELFWDVVDALDQQLDAKIVAMDVVQTPFKITHETSWEEFAQVIQAEADTTVNALSVDGLRLLLDGAVKKHADEKRRAERKQRHLQDDLRYALKKLPEPLDISLRFEDVVPLIENLPEYKALEDDEGRKAAFSKFVKRQKERMRETGSEDGGSTTSRKRKEPTRDHRDDDREKEREREREKERDRDRSERDKPREKERDSHRERDRERERDRGKDYERGARSTRHHHRYDEFENERRPSRDYGRPDREREKDVDREPKDREAYRSSKYHGDKEDRKKEKDVGKDREHKSSREGGSSHGRDHDDAPVAKKEERERSNSLRKEDSGAKREQEDKPSERAEKVHTYFFPKAYNS